MFHTTRLDDASAATPPEPPQVWKEDIERLEASGRKAVKELAGSHGSLGIQKTEGATSDPASESSEPAQSSAMGETAAQNAPQRGQSFEPATPETETDSFSPVSVANADIQPEDRLPGAASDVAIRDSMEVNRRAIEQAAAYEGSRNGHSNAISHDYLAMEDKAIDRLLQTTNALLETDDHTRKNQSLDRLKAAVVATEAERRIRVKTATGTVTLDFDEKGGTRRPVADLLATPNIDPEKRRQRLQDYRQMIADHKKRP